MCVRYPGIFLVLSILILFSCGEMGLGTVVPSSGSYKVNAYINETSLDRSAIIRQDDTILPYFVNSISNDPDVTGLAVSFQDTSANAVANAAASTIAKTLYSLKNMKGNAGEERTLVRVSRLDKEFPALTIPKDLPIGRYSMVFQVMGEESVLYQDEKPFFYLGDAEFSPNDINIYLPDESNSHLIPPGVPVLLETRLNYDDRLSPYVIWYDGKRRFGEGDVTEKTGITLWGASEQTGFHTIRAEFFPFKPEPDMRGSSRELSLAISGKAENAGYFSHIDTLMWYQFRGDIRDSKAPTATERSFAPKTEQAPVWLPGNGIYGLSIGPRDVYLLQDISPLLSGERKEGGFLIRLKPLSEGLVLSAAFNIETSPEPLVMYLLYDGAAFSLILNSPAGENAVQSPQIANDVFVSVIVDFVSGEDGTFSAGIRLEDSPVSYTSMFLPPLSGAGTIQLGGIMQAKDPPAAAAPLDGQDTAVQAIQENSAAYENTAIIDEFAVVQTAASLENTSR
jgi:hypothetical protein